MFTKEIYSSLMKCTNCGHAIYKKKINNYEIHEIYNSNYFKDGEYKDYLADERIIKKNFKLRLQNLKKNNIFKDNHLLEIGSAYGFFLDLAKEFFLTASGVELNKEALTYSSQNHKVWEKIEDVNSNIKYDVICLWDVLEHLTNPIESIKDIINISKNNHTLVFTTGDIGSLNARIFKKNWRLIHPPTHINYFTKKSICIMLKNLGYQITTIKYTGYYRSLDFIMYKLNVLKKLNSKFKLNNFSIYSNLYDIFYVEAKKIN